MWTEFSEAAKITIFESCACVAFVLSRTRNKPDMARSLDAWLGWSIKPYSAFDKTPETALRASLKEKSVAPRVKARIMLQSDLQTMSEGNVCFLLARKLITLSTILKQVWAFTMIVGERTTNSSTRSIVQQQIWQICYDFRIDARLHYPLEEKVILLWNWRAFGTMRW